jgi:hypothetical protein
MICARFPVCDLVIDALIDQIVKGFDEKLVFMVYHLIGGRELLHIPCELVHLIYLEISLN